MLKQFPHFEDLSMDHKLEMESFVSNYPPYSDFNFVSLWNYNTENDALVCYLNNNLVIRFRDYVTNERFYSFIGTTEVLKTTDTLLKYAEEQKVVPKLQLVPEIVVKSNPKLIDDFKVEEDENNYDYIVSADEISQLKGRLHHKKAGLARQFHNTYPDHEVKLLDPKDQDASSHIFDLFYEWESLKNKKREDTEHELKAIQRLLDNSMHFNLLIIGVYHDNKMICFIITEPVHNNYAMVHFLKANPQYKGLGEAIHKINSEHLVKREIKYVNLQQDLGIPGLREAKRQWHPLHFLKKYTITKK